MRVHAIARLKDDELLREAWELHMQKEEKRQPKRESELRRLENDGQKLRSQIDRYLSAFEEGTMPPEACAPRLQELHARQTDIQSRIERISADLNDDGPGITSLEEVKSVAAELADMLETYEDEDIPKLKELLRIVVKEILVNSREEIRPFMRMPLIRYDRFSGLNLSQCEETSGSRRRRFLPHRAT